MKEFTVRAIGTIQTGGEGMFIALEPAYIPALRGLEGFGHLDIIWWFSGSDKKELREMLAFPQPYKTAPEVMGVFATRSPVRPNPIALSTVEVVAIDYQKGVLQLGYIDADNGSPVLDIKPYTPSLDRVESPRVPGWCRHWPGSIESSGDFDWGNEFNF